MTIKLNRYEYEETNGNGEKYIAGYIVKEGVKPLSDSHQLVDSFEIEYKN